MHNSGEPMHTVSKKGNDGVVCPSYINNCLKVKYPLDSISMWPGLNSV